MTKQCFHLDLHRKAGNAYVCMTCLEMFCVPSISDEEASPAQPPSKEEVIRWLHRINNKGGLGLDAHAALDNALLYLRSTHEPEPDQDGETEREEYARVRSLDDQQIIQEAMKSPLQLVRELANRYDVVCEKLEEIERYSGHVEMERASRILPADTGDTPASDALCPGTTPPPGLRQIAEQIRNTAQVSEYQADQVLVSRELLGQLTAVLRATATKGGEQA